ncbi:PREDICTED: forkhead-associated domain-containing protein 1-like isoform X3 [Acropora digitifera]|uniref:forkhead-associated domain-containing protein 1-like isoform X3 n=1 Tax=Acropora digitifera TaxID=70779 RepID=UPI00077A64AA|nr:PREDICTED: forkhead-associated domain-containing protein 1-like isoform X3 [Acropora digitifera]
MRASLRSRDGSCVHHLRYPLTTIGCEGSDILIQQNPNVERQHAIIEYDESQGCFVVQDLNSAHGTYINDCRVQNAAVRLAPGDVVRFGYRNAGFDFQVDTASPFLYPSLSLSNPWESYRQHALSTPMASISSANVTSLPYINTVAPVSCESSQLYPNSQSTVSLPAASVGSASDLKLTSELKTNVMPHPPLRSRPTSAGATRICPSSSGGERNARPPVARVGWVNGTLQSSGEQSVQELQERLLRMGDELSRLASFEAECHRKDGVIAALRDEVGDFKAAALQASSNSLSCRAGGDDHSSINHQLRKQVSQLQVTVQEKEENEKTSMQKLAMYQNQLHAKNTEVATLKDQLHSAQSKATALSEKTGSDASTNKIASLRTEIAEKERKIAQITNDNEKLNKQKMQSTTLLNGLQRENSAKDALVHQAKREIEKLKKELREKDATISSMSAKMGKQKAAKEAEKEVQKVELELCVTKGKLQTAEKQLKERIKTISELENELENVRGCVDEGREKDMASQQELNHAKAQCLDAQRAEKLHKVDYQQLEKKFDRFRRKVIEYTFSGGFPQTVNRELDDDELLDHLRHLAQEKLSLVEHIKRYEDLQNEEDKEKDFNDSANELQKHLEGMEKRLGKSGRTCSSLEDELTLVEEFTTHDALKWFKDFACKMLCNEISWQQKSEEALRDVTGDCESFVSVENICRQLRDQKDESRKLKAKIAEMEETHQDVLLKLREDMRREEEKHISRAVADVRSVEEEKQEALMKDLQQKEQERIKAAVDTERKIMESQYGSVTQLQQSLNDRQRELENHRVALAKTKNQLEQSKDELHRAKQAEKYLRSQLQEQSTHQTQQLARVEHEKEELKNFREEEIASFKEQTRQHAVTIVAMEERLLRLTRQNKQLQQEALCAKQSPAGRNRPISPDKESTRTHFSRKESMSSGRPQSPSKDFKPQTRSVETETVPQTNMEATLKSDVYKLEQLVLLLRREAAQAKKEAESQGDVVKGLRRDLAGATARMSDMAGELSDKQKQKLEHYEEKIKQQDTELEEQRKQLLQLSAVVDEQQKEINSREDKLTEQEKALVTQKQSAAITGSELDEHREKLFSEIDPQTKKIKAIEEEDSKADELHTLGMRCRGERHELIIARQKEALAELRGRTKTLEKLKPPLPNHEQALQQIVSLKKEISELRAKLASQEEDYHKSEGEMHTELRVRREQASSSFAETEMEKGAHRQTKEALDLSEKTYLRLARTLGALLEIDPVPGCHSMAHLPVEERETLELERTKAVELMVSKLKEMYERIERKLQLLGSYEGDLVHLRDSEMVAGQKTAEATGLKMDVRNRQEEISYLRTSLSRLRDDLDQQRRLNVCLKERKKFAMDMEERDTKNSSHSCYTDERTRYKEELNKKKAAAKLKRKNYEIESLKKELLSADKELNDTAVKLQLLESSRNHSARQTASVDSASLDFDE